MTTTSVSSGRGPSSSRVASRAWAVVLAVHARARGHRLLQYAGPVILFGIVLSWAVLLSFGWALVFSAEGAFAGGAEAGFSQRLQFAATTVAGRGATSLELSDGAWWIIEQLCGLTGVALIGLSIAYALPVVCAVANKRQVAASVMILGGLRDHELPVRDADGVAVAVEDLADRRRLLRGFLAFEGRQWPPDASIGSDAPVDDQERSGAG